MCGAPGAEALGDSSVPNGSSTYTYAIPGPPTTFPALPDIKPLNYETYKLPNGMKVFLVEDHEVSLVSGVLAVKGGSYASPSDKVGLASAAVNVARASGVQGMPADDFDDRLDELAAGIEVGSSNLTFNYTFSARSADTPEVLHMVNELARRPALDPKKFESYRRKVMNIIEHKNDNASATAARETRAIMYGKNSLYARFPTKADIKRLSLDWVQPFLDEWVRPDAALLGIVGDFDSADLKKTLEAEFGDWKPAKEGPAPKVDLPSIPAPPPPGTTYLIDTPGASQSAVAIAELGIEFSDPDYFALDVLANTLNGFGGKLFDEVRSRQSLAYSVGGGWETPFDHRGLFIASGETSDPARFINSVQGVLKEACTEAPSFDAVEDSREQVVNTFVFNFASSAAQLQRLVAYDLLGLPADYLYSYKEGVEAVSTDDALAAAKRHLHPEEQIAVVVADAKKAKPALEAAGRNVVMYKGHLDP